MKGALRLLLVLVALIAPGSGAIGHALEPGFLDLRQLSPQAWQVFWRKPDVNGAPMAVDAVLPDDCTPARSDAPGFDGSAWVSAWVADCPGGLAGKSLRIDGLGLQNTDVLLRVETMGGKSSTYRLTPKAPGIRLPETPTTWSVLVSYTWLGFEHILEGWDHLLFVFALLVLIRDPWRLVGAITAFTVAHSITLALATLGHLSIPGPPVEAAIALSIVFLAVEILKHEDGHYRLSERAPWVVSFCFGLLHGLGFAGALTEIGLPQGDIPMALLAFNIGVEAGQLAFVGGVLAVVWLIGRILPGAIRALRRAHSPGTVVLGYAIGGTATYWFAERVSGF